MASVKKLSNYKLKHLLHCSYQPAYCERKPMRTLYVKRTFVIAVLSLVALTAIFVWWNFIAKRVNDLPLAIPPPSAQEEPQELPFAASMAKNLKIPWALVFLPNSDIVVTERAGRVRLVDHKRGLLPEPLLTINEVAHVGEGGLLGVTLHPDFAKNNFIYFYYTYQVDKDLFNCVVRYKKQDMVLSDKKVVIDNIPGATNHNGGRIKFGPDGYLYITTGDAIVTDLSQDKKSLAGKILRLKDDGSIPKDNPFLNSPVYSFGHRNPQGIAWDNQGRLWATEHGSSATDEVNLIEPGKNYGWPIIRGDQKSAGLEGPVIHSGSETWAPSGAAFLNGSLFFTGLRGQSLYEIDVDKQPIKLLRYLHKKFGRLREVVVGPDKFLYLLTSNLDGRGFPTGNDDQLIKINPEAL